MAVCVVLSAALLFCCSFDICMYSICHSTLVHVNHVILKWKLPLQPASVTADLHYSENHPFAPSVISHYFGSLITKIYRVKVFNSCTFSMERCWFDSLVPSPSLTPFFAAMERLCVWPESKHNVMHAIIMSDAARRNEVTPPEVHMTIYMT